MSEKTNKILYWFFTLWLSLGMVSTAIVQLMKLPEEVEKINQLGYPTYFLTLLGVWKLLGVIAVLVPKFLLLKEWAYAGFFFAMSGAAISHISCGHPITEVLPSLLLLSLSVISWYLRPENRKIKV
ncbi:DoxX family protein [Leptospira paudalimensis]|uniref:DoxX family protein n=1 Tax=Leptospira paudalimensis TaxID=2950024 RepID=A0ABT3MCH2_9LEPT|nr:DoxX family protein [Leptospira paudalimensis]MCW7506077.1 DoxX family protein [Leptospira paudalimensis]